jgi:FKBP-type peptidyl-prolyl cis-trans isomerase
MKSVTTMLSCARLVALLGLAVAARGADGPAAGTPPSLADFPLPAFSAVGSAIAAQSHIAELGWDEAQVSAFLDGEGAALRGQSYPSDPLALQLSAEMRTRVAARAARSAAGTADLDSAHADTAVAPAKVYPLSAYKAMGSSFAGKSHLAAVRLTDAQISALLDGERAVFQGRGFGADETAKRLFAELDRLISEALALAAKNGAGNAPADPGPQAAVAGSALQAAYPLSAYAAVGSIFAKRNHLTALGWSSEQVDAFIEGERSAFQGTDKGPDEASLHLLSDIGRRMDELDAREGQATSWDPETRQKYFKEMAKKMRLRQTDSGLYYTIVFGRQGIRPAPEDTVVISCAARSADDSLALPQLSSERVTVAVAKLLPGLREGCQMMTIDSKGVFVVPPELSFGDGAWPDGVPHGTPLVFRVTLLDVISAAAPH